MPTITYLRRFGFEIYISDQTGRPKLHVFEKDGFFGDFPILVGERTLWNFPERIPIYAKRKAESILRKLQKENL